MKTAAEMTDEELIDCIRELDPLVRPLIELKPNEAGEPLNDQRMKPA